MEMGFNAPTKINVNKDNNTRVVNNNPEHRMYKIILELIKYNSCLHSCRCGVAFFMVSGDIIVSAKI